MLLIQTEYNSDIMVDTKDDKSVTMKVNTTYYGVTTITLTPQEAQQLAKALRVYGELLEL